MDTKPSFVSGYLAGISVGSMMEFKRENIHGGWATFFVLVFLFFWRSLKPYFARSSRADSVAALVKTPIPRNSNSNPNSAAIGISEIITDADLRNLMNNLDGKLNEKERWEDVIDKRNNLMSYKAKCCKPKDGPLKYISVTTFENCSIELLRDFYMDNEYRKEWDRTLVEHVQLQIDESSGTEIGHTIKKFPLLTPREYVLAWRVWEGKDKKFYCFIKDCEHAQVPRQKKYVRVGFFRSGWRIRKAPGRDACEIAMVHQEDAGLNVEMAKIAFAKGIWSYVCKMDSALRKYSTTLRSRRSPLLTSLNFIQKVPSELENKTQMARQDLSESFLSVEFGDRKKISRKKSIAKGLLLIGGIICLSRGHASLGAKVMMACIVKKLAAKHESVSSEQNKQVTSLSTLEK